MMYDLFLYQPFDGTIDHHIGSEYTLELGTIVDSGYDLGMNNYPIFDENYRDILNQKILAHFWFREIGFETPGLFKHYLNLRMNEIMPFYNQYYESTLLKFDPLSNMNLTSDSDRNSKTDADSTEHQDTHLFTHGTDDSTNDTTSQSKSRALSSVTPQMQLSGHDDYATNLADTLTEGKTNAVTTSESNATSRNHLDDAISSTTEATEKYLSNVSGLQGITFSRALHEFRSTFLNIDMDVIHDLDELFMGIIHPYANYL